MSAESIFNKPESKRQKAVLARIAERQAGKDDSGIDYSDIPALTNAQLAQFNNSDPSQRVDQWLVWFTRRASGSAANSTNFNSPAAKRFDASCIYPTEVNHRT